MNQHNSESISSSTEAQLNWRTKALLSIREVAELTGLSRSGLYRVIASGKLPSVLVGRRRGIRPEALTRFLSEAEATHEVSRTPRTCARP